MVNSSKTPTGKTKKGQVTVRPDSGSIKACFPRTYFADGKQVKLGTGINPDDWEATATKLQRRLQLELEEGKLSTAEGIFNLGRYQEILEEYGLRAKLRVVKGGLPSDNQIPPKPELSLMEVWDMYCEYRKPGLRESTYKNTYQMVYKNFLEAAIKATNSEDALKIRNWLIENRSCETVKKLLVNLSKAYRLGMKNKLLSHNPYEGMAEEIQRLGAQGKTQEEIETDDDVLDQSKAYTWEEAQIILDYVENRPALSHWFSFLKFKFLTGCRTGEAIALRWFNVEWDKERIIIAWTHDGATKKFYPLKNDRSYKGEEKRKFPMPKDGELWNLLKSIPKKEPHDVVFESKTGKIIDRDVFSLAWRGHDKKKCKGIIPPLIEQGKLTKYLSPYNTRHTFITHAIFDLGIDEKIVSKWCGHTIDVSNKHYQDVAIFAERVNPEVKQQSELDLLKEQLRQQQELINKLLAEKDK
ncbi:tyrosine-type recombinase/integrase [Nostoc sp. FACHB-280]|uniref:tyrosine-type recombinase/integrase n=1 Tax=Nostoc sp. FACHB-280 TaxID=2692839 RepID=UPI00168A580F|nr:tyrosine-type recombinase/integrase [Nostoc sp. FACHB-280]MBD2495014.1 tyrosine-type recombinase/integrase [Nostoc sp. FACHB-280]